MPFPHTPQCHLPDSSTSPIPHPPTIILVFPTFTFRPFASIPTFHFNNFSLSSSSLSAFSTRSSAYRSSHGSPSRNSRNHVHYNHKQQWVQNRALMQTHFHFKTVAVPIT